MRIAFIGLGAIGAPTAAHLAASELDLVVFNRSPDKAVAFVQANGGTVADSAADAVAGAGVVFTCVPGDPELRQVFADDVVASLRAGAVVVDHTTASLEVTAELKATIEAVGCAFVDAPVSGGSAGAARGALTAMVGGSDEAVATVRPILERYCGTIAHLGPVGSGQATKMVNQLCIAGTLAGLAEGLNLAAKGGLDQDQILAAISGGAAGSWQMDNRGSFMIERSYPAGFAADLMLKDLELCAGAADQLGLDLPIGSMVREIFQRISADGRGREDFSVIYEYLDGGRQQLG